MKDRREPWQQVVIDGDTLEKRREQRMEQLYRFVDRLTPEDRKGVLGTVNQWTKDTGVRGVPAAQSVYDLNSKTKRLKNLVAEHKFSEPDPIRKRTPDERINAMVARLQTSTPETLEPMLTQVAGEYWKAGAPVTVDALRAVASHFLNRTERRK